MAEVECEQCGTPFDTEREPSTPGASTDRCPYCGTTADLEADGGDDVDEDAVEGGAPETTAIEAPPGSRIRITIEVEPLTDP